MIHGADALAAELTGLSDHYGLDAGRTRALAARLGLGTYCELVLSETGFELLTGGYDRSAELLRLAEDLRFPRPIIDAYAAMAGAFPGRMHYTKLPLGLEVYPSLYFVLIEPWDRVFAALEQIADLRGALDDLRAVIDSPVCFLLGFTLDPKTGALAAKAYHLLDRAPDTPTAPFLISHRIGLGGLSLKPKRYVMHVTYDHFGRISPAWRGVIDVAKGLVPWDTPRMLGFGEDPLARTVKLYLMRADCRQDASYTLGSYNYYYHEGLRLLDLGHPDLALRSFTNAVHYQPNHSGALNSRGYCHILLRQFHDAVRDCAQACALDPGLSRANLAYARAELDPAQP